MNKALLKDKRWLIYQGTSILAGIIGIILSFANNYYWILFAILTLIFMSFAVNRAARMRKRSEEG